jgi:hypothetical protein
MKTKMIVFALLATVAAACGTLTSVTTIESQNSFVLGNNPHAPFSVQLKNISKKDVVVHREPLDGGRHSFETVTPGQTVHVKVEANTALVIANQSAEKVDVKLYVVGDTGLSMGYKDK